MATFTKIEDLFDTFPQSVGGLPTEGGNGNDDVRIFQPDRGLDVLIKNVGYLDREPGSFPTGITDSFDNRQTLGTITLNNRDFWENSNYNKNSFQPYLKGGRETVRNQVVLIDGNGDEIIFNEARKYSTFKFSIDAIPFVINPNTDEIVRLDRYYDKNIDSEKYNLATEGKINYYILPRGEGRTEKGNIDTLGYKGLKTKNGKNRFDAYASGQPDIRGYHLFRLDWGDGTPLEHTTKTKLLEGTTLLEHSYEKPGFYTIKGVVMAFDGFKIGSWEKFETNILVNASNQYDVDLYNYENFATIGGITPESVLVKSATDIVGINPLTFDTNKALPEAIENINLFDRLNLFNFLTKIDWPILNNFYSDFMDYTKEIYDEPKERLVEDYIFGCLDPQGANYQPDSDSDLSGGRTLCEYDLQIRFNANAGGDNKKVTIYFLNQDNINSILEYPPEDEPDFFTDGDDGFDNNWANQNDNYSQQLNPSRTPGRKQALINTLGTSWVDSSMLEGYAYEKVNIYTNPGSNQSDSVTISRDSLVQANKILIKSEAVSTSQQDNILVESTLSVPSPSDIAGLERNPLILDSFNSSVKVVKSYNVRRNQNLTYSSVAAPAPSYVQMGYQYNYDNPASNFEIFNTKISTLIEINAQELQNIGSTESGGVNGLYDVNVNVAIEGGGGSNGGGDGDGRLDGP